MRYLIVLCFLLLLDHVFSQENLLESKNQYTFSLVSGLNRNATKVEFGEKSPENALGVVPGFNFHYTRILSPKFSLATGLGFGFLPINLKLNYGELNSRVNFHGFSKYELLGSYHLKLNDTIELKFSLGSGIFSYGLRNTPDNYGYQNSYDYVQVEMRFNSSLIPFVFSGIEVNKMLKNNNILSLKLNYYVSFSNAFSGTYFYISNSNGQTSNGQYFNRGNYLNLSLGYTSTRKKRLDQINEIQKHNQVDTKKAKQILKKGKRFIDTKSLFLNISGGLGYGKTIIDYSPEKFLLKFATTSLLPRITIEKGVKNNIYWELGIHSQLFNDATRFHDTPYPYGNHIFKAFYVVQLSGGGLYRLILKNNFNLLNIHTGLTLGFHGSRNNENGIYSLSTIYNPLTFEVENIIKTSKVKSNVLTSLYLGLSKDVRIVKNFYFTLNYRQQFGLYRVFESTYDYSDLNVPTTIRAKTKITGSSKDFQFGFKIKLK